MLVQYVKVKKLTGGKSEEGEGKRKGERAVGDRIKNQEHQHDHMASVYANNQQSHVIRTLK
jgi:hypothetical protein